MKYMVNISPPKAKRMAESGKLVIAFSDGWVGDSKKEYKIEKFGEMEFEVPDDCERGNATSTMDGFTFSVSAEYENSKKKKKESCQLVPWKV